MCQYIATKEFHIWREKIELFNHFFDNAKIYPSLSVSDSIAKILKQQKKPLFRNWKSVRWMHHKQPEWRDFDW